MLYLKTATALNSRCMQKCDADKKCAVTVPLQWPAANKAPVPNPLLCATSPAYCAEQQSACGPVTARQDDVQKNRSSLSAQRQTFPQTFPALSLICACEIILSLHRSASEREEGLKVLEKECDERHPAHKGCYTSRSPSPSPDPEVGQHTVTACPLAGTGMLSSCCSHDFPPGQWQDLKSPSDQSTPPPHLLNVFIPELSEKKFPIRAVTKLSEEGVLPRN